MDIVPQLAKLWMITLRFLKLFQQTCKISSFNSYKEHIGLQWKIDFKIFKDHLEGMITEHAYSLLSSIKN